MSKQRIDTSDWTPAYINKSQPSTHTFEEDSDTQINKPKIDTKGWTPAYIDKPSPTGDSLKRLDAVKNYFDEQNAKVEAFKTSLADVDASDAEKDYIIDMMRKGASEQEIDDAKLTLQGLNPVQNGVNRYYLEDNQKGYKTIKPLAPSQKAPKGVEIASIWGTQEEANYDAWYTDLTKMAWNGLVKASTGIAADLPQVVYGAATGEQLDWAQSLKNAGQRLQFKTDEDINKGVIKTENIKSFSDFLDSKNYDFTPENIWGTALQVGQSLEQFAVSGGAAGMAGVANNTAKLFLGSYVTNLGEAMDTANELGVTGRDAYLTALAVTVPVSLIDTYGGKGAESLITQGMKKEGKDNLVKQLVKETVQNSDGKITREVLDNAYKNATEVLETVIKNEKPNLLKAAATEGAQEISQNALQRTSQIIHDNLVEDDSQKYGVAAGLKRGYQASDLISPQYIAELGQDAIGGFMGGGMGYVVAKRAYDKNENKSKSIMEAIGKGNEAVTELKTELSAALKRGDINQEDYDRGIFKVDTYKKYSDAMKVSGENLNDYAKQKIFDLTYERANRAERIKQLEENNPDGINDGIIANIKSEIKDYDNQIAAFRKDNPAEAPRTENPNAAFEYQPEPPRPYEHKGELDAKTFNNLGVEEKFLNLTHNFLAKPENERTLTGTLEIPTGYAARVKLPDGRKIDLASSTQETNQFNERGEKVDNSILQKYAGKPVAVKYEEDEISGRHKIALYDQDGNPIVRPQDGQQYNLRATTFSHGQSRFGSEAHLTDAGKQGFEGTIPMQEMSDWKRGELEGADQNEANQIKEKEWIDKPIRQPLFGEKRKQFEARALNGIKQLIGNAKNGTVVVANNDVMRLAAAWAKAVSSEENAEKGLNEIEVKREDIHNENFGHEDVLTLPLANGGQMHFVRNSETDQHEQKRYRTQSVGLNQKGIETAARLANKLKGLGEISDIITSPQLRSKETARIIKRIIHGDGDVGSMGFKNRPVAPSGGNESLSEENKNTNLAENGEQGQQQETISTGRSGSATLGAQPSDRGNSQIDAEKQSGSQENNGRTQKQPRKRSTKPRKLRSTELLRASQLEVFKAKEAVLQWFINGGKIQRGNKDNPIGLKKLFSSEEEINKRISLTNSKTGYKSLDGIAEAVQTDFVGRTGNDTIDFKEFHDAVNEVLNDHESISSMAKELLALHDENKFNPREQAFIEEENASGNVEENDIVTDITTEQTEQLPDENLATLANDQAAHDEWLADQDTNQFGSEHQIDDEAGDIQQYDGDIQFQTEEQIAKPNRFQKITQEQFRKLLNRLKRAFPKIKINVLSSKELGDVLGENWDKVQKQAVWHGSPHSFDKFSTSKIGTGEGNQAFGYGLYFTDLKDIAEKYTIGQMSDVLDEVITSNNNDIDEAIKSLQYVVDNNVNGGKKIWSKYLEEAKRIKSKKNLYKVKIHGDKTIEELNFLNWDKQVPDDIFDKIGKAAGNNVVIKILAEPYNRNGINGETLYKNISRELNSDKKASEFLLKAGIDGIRYPAESLSKGATSETARGFNYVVFDENAVEIDEKIQFLKDKNNHVYGFVKDGQVYINGDTLNVNTPIHEFGHVWTNMLKGANPALYKKGLDLVKNTKYYDRIKKNKNYANLTEEQILEEALVTAIGDRGEAFLTAGSKSKFKEWLQKLKEFLTDKFFINQKGKLDNLTLDQFLDGALGDILGGKEIQIRQDKKEKERAEIIAKAKANGTYLKAPNGKPTNLTPEQWVTVRTKAFKKWFGDWENEPENASKVIDDNGEPLVVYHGTRSQDEFYVFDAEKGNPSNNGGHYFSNNIDFAKKFAGTKGKVFSAFLNIKNPNTGSFDYSGAVMTPSIYRDGGIFTKTTSDKYAEKGAKEYIVFNPNQIKSATSNTGDFSSETGNINFQIVGEKAAKTKQELTDSLSEAKEMDEQDLPTKYVLYDKKNGVSKEFTTKRGAENYLNTDGAKINGHKISKANSVIKEVSKELQIKLKTGWEKVHGSWWYETDDNNTTFKNAKELADSILNVADNTQTLVGKLGDLLNAEELFSLYPELAKVDVYLNTNNLLPESSNAAYNEKTNSIHINARRLQRLYSDNGQHSDAGGLGGTNRNIRPEDLEYSLASGTLKGKIIHEIQHAVQTQEDWYRGTGVVQVEKYLKQQGYEKYSMPKKQWDSLVYHTYLRWAGENQAHAAEIRNKRTAEQRRETLLSENEPIERALQILERGDNPIQFQFESAEDMEDESESEENEEEEKSNYFQKAVRQFGKFTPASKEYAIKKRHGVSIRKLEEELLGGNLTEERREEIEKLLEQYQDEYESFRDDVDTLKDLLEESRNVEDIPLEDLLKYATTIELYDDLKNNAYFKDVQLRIAQHIFNKRMAELEKIQAESGRNLHLGQAKFRDMSKSDIMLKALSDVQHYFPELQEFAKMWDEVVQNYQDEARKLSKEHNRLGKEVIKEDRAKQGLAPVRIWRWITQDNSHHFSWLNENGKLITEAQARAKGYSQTRLDYLKNYREIKKHFASEQDKTRVLYDDLTLLKSKTNFPETLKGEGLLAAVQGYMYNFNGKVEEVVIKYGNDFKTLAEVNEDLQKQAKRGLLSKPMAYIKSMYYGMKAMKYYAKRVNEDGSKMPDINYASNYSLSQTNRITNQFGSEYKNEKFTQDFHQTMLHYINDMSFSKNVSPIMPVLNSIQYYNENKIFGKEKKENVAKFLEYWKEKHIFQQNKVLLPQADWAMRTIRHMTSLAAMTFNLKAGTWNIATGKYNAWREDGLKNAVIGEKRFFSNPKKTRAIMKNFNVASHEDVRDFKTGLGNGFAKLSRIFSSWGEYQIQGTQFMAQIEENDFNKINDNGEYEGTEEEQKAFKEKVRQYKKHIQDVQGKYAKHERRNYELWEMGRFMGQFKTWIPDWFINRFGERSEGVYGEQGGSWRYISDGIKQIGKDMSTKEFFTSKKPEYKAMRRNLYDALTVATLLIFRYGGDDDEDKRRKATILGQAAENLLFIYDPHTWEYTLTNPAAGVRTTKLFLQAIGDLATGERYKTGEHKGELKGLQKAKNILPYNKISNLDEQFEKLRGEDD